MFEKIKRLVQEKVSRPRGQRPREEYEDRFGKIMSRNSRGDLVDGQGRVIEPAPPR